ncbi:MAG: MOSC domain-containing protein [Chloroflexi bacterium]|nr:MOSC domain-containing protein [Chloroflexota bacterium]
MRLISINVSLPLPVTVGAQSYDTAIYKMPVAGAFISRLNVEGDRQADPSVHGGPDKAVYAYSFDHYPHWEVFLGQSLQPGAFGENLTIAGLDEREVCIGDAFEVGGALVQITQPRQPCFKLANKHGRPDVLKEMRRTDFSGAYFRVLREGQVSAGDAFELAARHPGGVTVAYACQVNYFQKDGADGLRRLLAVPELSEAWRGRLSERLTMDYLERGRRQQSARHFS